MKVFLSHSSVDKALARRLGKDLQHANIDVWFDQWEIGVGEEFTQTIERGVDESEFVIVLLTKASVSSDWVKREWRRKFEEEMHTKHIGVIPVRGEACEIPDFLAQRTHAGIAGGSYPLGFRFLLEILQNYADHGDIAVTEAPLEEDAFSQRLIPIVTPIALEVGSDLIPIFEKDEAGANHFLDELAPELRNALLAEFGFPFPGIRIRGNVTDMPPRAALILIDEIPEVMLEIDREEILVDSSVEALAEQGIVGTVRNDPMTGSTRAVIAPADRDAADGAGLVTLDAAEYLILTLHSVIRRNAALFIDIDMARRLVDRVEQSAPTLVENLVPNNVSWIDLTTVLQRLVEENIGINDMARILEALSRIERDQHEPMLLTDTVRHALRGQITKQFTRGKDALSVIVADPEIEARIGDSIQDTAVGRYLNLDPQITQAILSAVREQVHALQFVDDAMPIILTTVEARPYMRKLVELEYPWLHALSRDDLNADVKLCAVGRITLDGSSGASPADGQEQPK